MQLTSLGRTGPLVLLVACGAHRAVSEPPQPDAGVPAASATDTRCSTFCVRVAERCKRNSFNAPQCDDGERTCMAACASIATPAGAERARQGRLCRQRCDGLVDPCVQEHHGVADVSCADAAHFCTMECDRTFGEQTPADRFVDP